ncbi:hypothetical protein KIN20_011178 [Parelaphostrongylus tenuis]|uniref:Uncharacterized protein n=1 Tax=Parelaphostrongylus tenuis TaxID=148309 RepID=A0AAD5QLV5_PARTN|nr:hypothetical protein KIN20_011178 [Parelaphostrongylus tenuis]
MKGLLESLYDSGRTGDNERQQCKRMNILVNTGSATDLFTISLLATISTVLGCGVLPPGQGSTRIFNVTGFTLPVAMAYAGNPAVFTKVPGIAFNMAGARIFVGRLVRKAVLDVLKSQGRSALLPDAVISAILGQLSVKITYRPLRCDMAVSPQEELAPGIRSCVIVDNTVTRICTVTRDRGMCTATNVMAKLAEVPATALTIGGTLSKSTTLSFEAPRQPYDHAACRAKNRGSTETDTTVNISANMVRNLTDFIMISLLATISTMPGCGVMSQAPWLMRENPKFLQKYLEVQLAKRPAQGFGSRLTMQTIFVVFESQTHSALLPHAVISPTLGQLNVTFSYKPISCYTAASLQANKRCDSPSCIIVSNTVTGICNVLAGMEMCTATKAGMIMIVLVLPTALAI